MSEEFLCPRCGYRRTLSAGEDGFRLYLLHEERCRPQPGRQLWLPIITEDSLRWPEALDAKVAISEFRLPTRRTPGVIDRGKDDGGSTALATLE